VEKGWEKISKWVVVLLLKLEGLLEGLVVMLWPLSMIQF
jgi:hypothetical protein